MKVVKTVDFPCQTAIDGLQLRAEDGDFAANRAMKARFNISTKLLLAFIGMSVMAVLIMVGVLRFFANRSFEEYMRAREFAAVTGVADRLRELYQEDGGWEELRGDRRAWGDLVRDELDGDDEQGHPRPPGDRHDRRPPPPGDDDFHDRRPPPPDGRRPPPGEHPPHFGDGPPGPDGQPRDRDQRMGKLNLRLSLFDANEKLVAGGDQDPKNYALSKLDLNGKTIGYLALHHAPRVDHPMDAQFLNRQLWTLYLTGAVIIAVSSLIALALAHGMSAPIRQMAEATGAIAARDFKTRLSITSSDELGLLARGINQMAATLGGFETRQHQWLADVAHELRNPLAVLIGEIEAIQDGVRAADEAGLASLHAEALRLSRIVNDLRLLSLADAGELPLEMAPLDPIETIANALEHARPTLASAGLSVEARLASDDGLTVMADRDRLTQVFANVIENARKYADSPGALLVSSVATPGFVTITIEDTGPGIPDSALPLLFDRLFRVDKSRSRETGGSGLGLSICKSIVQGHGGTIQALHSHHGGLRVDVSLPLK